MIIRGFNYGDIKKIALQKEQKEEFVYGKAFPFNFTAEHNGEIMAVFAYQEIEPRKYMLGAFISRNAGKCMIALVRGLKKKIEKEAKQNNALVLYFSVLSGFKQAERLAVLLGFSFKEELPDYFNGKDYELYERKMR